MAVGLDRQRNGGLFTFSLDTNVAPSLTVISCDDDVQGQQILGKRGFLLKRKAFLRCVSLEGEIKQSLKMPFSTHTSD